MNTYTETSTRQRLIEQCKTIANNLSNWDTYAAKMAQEGHGEANEFTVYDYLKDVLDIHYLVDRDKDFISAQLLVAFGGPNIWVDFDDCMVKGYWGSDEVKVPFTDSGHIENALEDLYNN